MSLNIFKITLIDDLNLTVLGLLDIYYYTELQMNVSV
jgi:hypothetical protein